MAARVLLQLCLRALQLAGELGRQFAAAIDFADELCVRARRAFGGDARGRGGLLQPGHFGPARFERAVRRAKAHEILLMLLGAMAIDCGHRSDHAIRAADFPQIGHVEEQTHVAGTSQLVEFDHSRFEDRPRRRRHFFELRDLIARVAQLAADFLRLRFNLSELFGPEIALDFEAPQIAEQRPLLTGERIGLALQCDHAVVGPAGLRFGPRTVARLRDTLRRRAIRDTSAHVHGRRAWVDGRWSVMVADCRERAVQDRRKMGASASLIGRLPSSDQRP